MPLVHHELCFGCGRTNLFGLLVEVEPRDDGSVAGRCFIKQDHQGPDPGLAHEGVIATALSEAMALACGLNARARMLEMRVEGKAPVGTFLELEAEVEESDAGSATARARAMVGTEIVGRARGRYLR